MFPLTLLQPRSDVKTAPGGPPDGGQGPTTRTSASATEAAPASAISTATAAIEFLQSRFSFCDFAVILFPLSFVFVGYWFKRDTLALVIIFLVSGSCYCD